MTKPTSAPQLFVTFDSTTAVFLSYASQDAEAARRIAEALRGFGVKVWFDQNELRGGDQWDNNIRRQIKECSLFIPVISATTQSRDEAYFRLEWKLADDRSHLMAPGKPFIVPVVIDDTPDYGASVPDSFTKAQWTRLPGGDPSTTFIDQVKRLTAPKTGAVNLVQPKNAAAPSPTAQRPPSSSASSWRFSSAAGHLTRPPKSRKAGRRRKSRKARRRRTAPTSSARSRYYPSRSFRAPKHGRTEPTDCTRSCSISSAI